ncbi:MAG: hypothetical protein JWP42_4001 [Pseudomonas sp.]|nr:hypothetical protein [Pseudomonas sp.]
MNQEIDQDNPSGATRFSLREFVSRTEFKKAPRLLDRVLNAMDEATVVEPGTREYHQHQAMKAAELVAHQYTREAKKQSKRDCLGHLIASLAPNGASKNKASS